MRRPSPFLVLVACLVFLVGLVACAESSSPPPASALTPAVSLDVPPLPPPKPVPKEPAARQVPPAPPPRTTTMRRRDHATRPPPRPRSRTRGARWRPANFVKACGLFRESLRFDRAAGTLLNLAQCEEKVGDRSSALRHYLAAEAEATKNGQRDRAAFARERAAALMAGP
ncbi:MAG: hypothetical protein U0270_16645 [Labilithrix sp.]